MKGKSWDAVFGVKTRQEIIERGLKRCERLGGIPEIFDSHPACKLGKTKVWMGPIFSARPEATTLIWMRPEEFLSKVPRIQLDKETVQMIFEGISSGRPTDIPYIDLDDETGEITGHEGRHRMQAFRRLGVQKVPVLAFHWKKGRYTSAENSIDELIYPK